LFEEQFLTHLSATLANDLGPIASLLVKNAAKKARDKSELVRSLADGIPVAAQRERFLEAVQPGALESKKHDSEVKPSSRTASAPTAQGFPVDWLARVEPLLAKYIGPMAGIIIKKAARKARNKPELITALAATIENQADRSDFIAAFDKLPAPSKES
jgi:serine/threonine-protein kinase